MTTDNSNNITSAYKKTSTDNTRDFRYWAVQTLKTLLLLIILHISVICIVDIAGQNNWTKINYPIIHNYFVLGIFFLPLIGSTLLFVKKLSYKLLGSYLLLVSVWDIYLFLNATEGAL